MPNRLLSLSVTGRDLVQRQVQALSGNAIPALGRALFGEASELIAVSKAQHVPVDLGRLRASGQVVPPEVHGTRVTVHGGFGGPAAPYALYVHEGIGPAVGRPAFQPSRLMVEALEEWGRRHGFPRGSGFMIARAIGRRGFTGRKYLEHPFRARQHGFAARVATAFWAHLQRGGWPR